MFTFVTSDSAGQGSNGSRRARRSEVGETTTWVEGDGAADVGRKSGLPVSKPEEGSSCPLGGENLNGVPSGLGMLSVRGLKVVEPA